MQLTSVTVITSPYHVGIRNHEVGSGPGSIKSKDLISTLQTLGVKVFESELEVGPASAEGDIGRYFNVLRHTSKLVTAAREVGSFPIILSGNCGATIGVLAGIQGSKDYAGRENDIGCVWFDAHDDYNIPDTVLSGYFDSMPIAIMAGQCWKALRDTIPGLSILDLNNLVHVGLRDLNELELARVIDAKYPVVWGSSKQNVDFPKELSAVLKKRSLPPSMVHIDLDCLDSTVGQVNKFAPAPGGLSAEDLNECLKILAERATPLSLTVASYDPAYDKDGKIADIAVKIVTGFIYRLIEREMLRRDT